MLKNIILQNFRNYKKLSLDLGKRTILFGKNAQGKTNILEAIYLLCTLKSFRSKDVSLIGESETFTSVEGEADKKLKLVIQNIDENIKKTALKNGVKIKGPAFLKSFLAVIFSPEDVELIKASPGARRRHLDILLCKLDPMYTEALIGFKRTLLQRNALLKNIKYKRAREGDLEIWDKGFLELGNFIIKKRKEFIELINKNIDDFYKKISGTDELVRLSYVTGYEDLSLEEALKKSLSYDILCGTTSVGPHRDDIRFRKEEKDIREFGSRGEFRTVILAIKLCEGDIFEKKLKKDVTYLLDDVFSELDTERRKSLLDIIGGKQVIITTTDLDHIAPEFMKGADVYEVSEGKIKEIKD